MRDVTEMGELSLRTAASSLLMKDVREGGARNEDRKLKNFSVLKNVEDKEVRKEHGKEVGYPD